MIVKLSARLLVVLCTAPQSIWLFCKYDLHCFSIIHCREAHSVTSLLSALVHLQLLAGKVSNLPDFNATVWRERTKKLKAKQAALADGAAVIGPTQGVDPPAAAQPASQVYSIYH